MNPDLIRDLDRRLRALERTSVRYRQGVVTSDSPLAVALGGDTDNPLTDVQQLHSAGALQVDDVIAALQFASDLLVLGRMTTPDAWTAPTLTSPWTNNGGAADTAAYRKTGDLVAMKGLVGGGNKFATIFTLPTGYRPAAERRVAAPIIDGGSRYGGYLLIASDGTVKPYVDGPSDPLDSVSLDVVFAL
jgi:hypothetical protein